MTVMQIIRLAMRQLDEVMEDVDDFYDLFLPYLNEGYDIAVRRFLKPRRELVLRGDVDGTFDVIPLDPMIERVVELYHMPDHQPLQFGLMPDGKSLCVWHPPDPPKLRRKHDLPEDGEPLPPDARHHDYLALCEVRFPPLLRDVEEPKIDPSLHPALADYICYRHLSNGNLAKQQRAAAYQQRFYQQMAAIRPEGYRSVTQFRNLYSATDVHAGR